MKSNVYKIIFLFVFFVNVAKVQAQAAILALIFGDKVASETFHLTLDAGYNFASMPGLVEQKTTGNVYFGLGTYIKLSEKWALTPEFKPLSPRGAREVCCH